MTLPMGDSSHPTDQELANEGLPAKSGLWPVCTAHGLITVFTFVKGYKKMEKEGQKEKRKKQQHETLCGPQSLKHT